LYEKEHNRERRRGSAKGPAVGQRTARCPGSSTCSHRPIRNSQLPTSSSCPPSRYVVAQPIAASALTCIHKRSVPCTPTLLLAGLSSSSSSSNFRPALTGDRHPFILHNSLHNTTTHRHRHHRHHHQYHVTQRDILFLLFCLGLCCIRWVSGAENENPMTIESCSAFRTCRNLGGSGFGALNYLDMVSPGPGGGDIGRASDIIY
jgi:hypothetical protein